MSLVVVGWKLEPLESGWWATKSEPDLVPVYEWKGEPMSGEHVELFKGDDGDWYFRFVAANGEQLTRSSEGYQNRPDAVAAIRLAHGENILIRVDDGDDGA